MTGIKEENRKQQVKFHWVMKKETEEGIEVNETKKGKKGKQMQMERM